MTVEVTAEQIEAALPPGTPQHAVFDAHEQLCRMLGLVFDATRFERLFAEDHRIGAAIARWPGLRPWQTPTIFASIVWAIIGQQINLAFAYQLRGALIEAAGEPIGGGLIAHPTPARVAELEYADLTERRFSRRKAEYVIDLARKIAGGEFDLAELAEMDAPRAESALMAQRGIGLWTARYVMLRGLGFADAAPLGDAGLARALMIALGETERLTPARIEAEMSDFEPFRGLATFQLWRGLAAAEA
jgi:3-methyladenine DNA glycosylase/8-oxoguanine DNA glycosylase